MFLTKEKTVAYNSISDEEEKKQDSGAIEVGYFEEHDRLSLSTSHYAKQQAIAVALFGILCATIGSAIGGHYSKSMAPLECGISTAPVFTTPESSKHWIFAELNSAEVRAVAAKAKYLLPGDDIRTSMSGPYSEAASYITGTSAVELIPPPKEAARAYLDGKIDEPPARYAKVTVARGETKDVMEYKIGPIKGCDTGDCGSISVGDEVTPLTKPGEVSWAKRPVDLGETWFMKLVSETVEPLSGVLLERFGPIFDDYCDICPEGKVLPFSFNDIESNSTHRVSKMMFFWYRDFDDGGYDDSMWLHPLPFSFHIDQKDGGDEGSWTAYDIKLCVQGPYETPDDLLAAIEADDGSKFGCSIGDITSDGYRGSFDSPGAPIGAPGRKALEGSMPARMVSRPGTAQRWRSSNGGASKAAGRMVEWQGWSFYTTVRPSTGLAVLDVKFKGNRIAHELALSEAMAAYSGSVDDGDQIYYLDAAYSMSQLGGPLVPGVDCPFDAEYVDDIATFHVLSNTKGGLESDPAKAIGIATACIFEEDTAETMWRHTTFTKKKSDGVRNSALVVRHVTTVGNYDYITEFKFGLDGSVKIGFNFAGYCETRWHSALMTPEEGPRAHGSLSEILKKNLAAPLHSHFGAFKLDLDVLGTHNTFEVIEAKSGIISDVEGSSKYATKYLDTSYVSLEEEGVSTKIVDPQHPSVWRIVNRLVPAPGDADEDSKSRPPGYAIIPGATIINTLPDDHPFVLSAAFSKYNLVVTKRHESEQRCTSVYDLYGPSQPTVSIRNFIDGENIEDTDLVAWISLGKEHIPRTEDLPLISSTFGVSATLMPWNIFEGHAGMDIPEETPSECYVTI